MTTPVKILYIGASSGTSLDRASALSRLGHHVTHIDPRNLLPKTVWVERITWRIGGQLMGPLLLRALPTRMAQHYDLCFVDSGDWVTPRVIRRLHQFATTVINYNIDDPLGPRDIARFAAYRMSLPYYDLCVVMRPQNITEARALGAKRAMRVNRCADEVSHAPRELSPEDKAQWAADVLFVGTWFPERGPFLLDLVQRGVPLTIRGANWTKASEWSELKAYWKGGELQAEEYAKAIQCAKVNLGLLSKGNRDLHTTRSLEIPALGGLLCAERTVEHSAMYTEGQEALFWGDAEECANACFQALRQPELSQRIAAAGLQRIHVNGDFNEKTLQAIIDYALVAD